ncbi:MAE_28990/MAE_18760 family HEPN-like nuclease [Holdemanella biformis]|jgi:hypothetical protein|uniref:MAE_28990/MAE_18760 family HEPN-like nuclease n=1 Tax=Holdemanella biformis TaxID=1735 RepID=UPI003AB86704
MYFVDEINSDIQWRMSELASLKTIPLRYNLLSHHKEMLIKYTIPSIYALWEGFVKNSFELYVREINKLNIPIEEVHINVITHTLSSCEKLYLENPRMNFISKKEFVEFYQSKISKPLNITTKIPTKSNVDFIVINDILTRFNLTLLPKVFERKLNKLLKFRNSIAHGETSLPVKMEDVTFFSQLVNDLMVEIITRLDEGYKKQTFKK